VLLMVSRDDWRTLSLGQFGTPSDMLILISAPNRTIFSALSWDGLHRYSAALTMFFVMGLDGCFLRFSSSTIPTWSISAV